MSDKENPALKLLDIAKASYSVENTLEAYKFLHEALSFTYHRVVDFSLYDGTIASYIKNSIHLSIDICMDQLSGLTQAVTDACQSMGNKAKYDLDLIPFMNTLVNFCTITIINFLDNPHPVVFPNTIDEKYGKQMTESDKNLCLLFDTEMSMTVTLAMTMLKIIYGDDESNQFKSLVSQWISSISNVFLTIILVKNMQKGDNYGC